MSKKAIRVRAAHAAVHTLRLNRLAATNIDEVQKLCQDIIDKQFQLDDDVTREGIIAREISKTTWQSFCRFGSRRSASKGMILCWINNNDVPLDEQAMFISEQYSVEILPDELAEFIMRYDKGMSTYEPIREIEEMKKAFKYLTGFNWNLKFVKTQILSKRVGSQQIDDLPF